LQKGKKVVLDTLPPLFPNLILEPPLVASNQDSSTSIIDYLAKLALSITYCTINMILQYCEWHAVIAIKKKLIVRRYSKQEREKIADLIWRWVKAGSIDALNTSRDALLAVLHSPEQAYILDFY
jgi:hypothetical protein